MFRIRNKNIYLNRGDRISVQLVNNQGEFEVGDKIRFSICKQGNYDEVIFSKSFIIDEKSNHYELELTSEETSIGEPFGEGSKTYWYEIELNGDTTLIGYDTDGPKKFILYPEAGIKEVNE